jgi:hypothetical protein
LISSISYISSTFLRYSNTSISHAHYILINDYENYLFLLNAIDLDSNINDKILLIIHTLYISISTQMLVVYYAILLTSFLLFFEIFNLCLDWKIVQNLIVIKIVSTL